MKLELPPGAYVSANDDTLLRVMPLTLATATREREAMKVYARLNPVRLGRFRRYAEARAKVGGLPFTPALAAPIVSIGHRSYERRRTVRREQRR